MLVFVVGEYFFYENMANVSIPEFLDVGGDEEFVESAFV